MYRRRRAAGPAIRALLKEAALLLRLLRLHVVGLADGSEHSLHAGLLNLARHNVLVQNVVRLGKVKDQIQLAHLDKCLRPRSTTQWRLQYVFKVPIERLHIAMQRLQDEQLILLPINARHKVQAGVALVDDRHVAILDKVAGAGRPAQDQAGHLLDVLLSLPQIVAGVPLGQPQLALSADQQDKVDLHHPHQYLPLSSRYHTIPSEEKSRPSVFPFPPIWPSLWTDLTLQPDTLIRIIYG